MKEHLMALAAAEGIDIIHSPRLGRLAGLYVDNIIVIHPEKAGTDAELTCLLAEELGHHFTSVGDIRTQKSVNNRKQERQARAWGYERLVSFDRLIAAFEAGVKNRYELAEYLEVTESFVADALKYYREKHDQIKQGHYIISFADGLHITKYF